MIPNCTTRELTFKEVRRGQATTLIGAVVDQDNNVKGSLISYINESAKLGEGEGVVSTNKVRTPLACLPASYALSSMLFSRSKIELANHYLTNKMDYFTCSDE